MVLAAHESMRRLVGCIERGQSELARKSAIAADMPMLRASLDAASCRDLAIVIGSRGCPEGSLDCTPVFPAGKPQRLSLVATQTHRHVCRGPRAEVRSGLQESPRNAVVDCDTCVLGTQ
jgi:hypothetical protein